MTSQMIMEPYFTIQQLPSTRSESTQLLRCVKFFSFARKEELFILIYQSNINTTIITREINSFKLQEE